MNDSRSNAFLHAFRGHFTSLLKWSELDIFWELLKQRADRHWYVYVIGEPPPTSPLPADSLIEFIDRLGEQLRREHTQRYCGIVYADSRTEPTFIKVYDPNNLGAVCGFSDNPPLPGWIICQLRPVRLDGNPAPQRRWWHSFQSAFKPAIS